MKIFSRSVMIMLLMGILLLSAGGCDEIWDDMWDDVVPEGESTGNKDADAAIETGKIIKDIKEADKLMDKAEELRAEAEAELDEAVKKEKLNKAADKMDEAIEKRPDDWSYRISRMGVAFELNEPSTVENQRNEALGRLGTMFIYDFFDKDQLEAIPHPKPREEYRYYTQLIDTLESGRFKPDEMNEETKYRYYQELSFAYKGRYEANEAGGVTFSSHIEHGNDHSRAVYYATNY